VIILDRSELADLPITWPTVSSTVLAAGKIGTFVAEEVQAPGGEVLNREYLRHPGAVGVIALDEEDRVALVRQYRHPVRHRLIEPPAGLLDVSGEDPLAAVQRELAEEVHLAADRWNVLVDVLSTPGIVAETVRIYLARDLHRVGPPDGFARTGEEAEMDTVWASLDDLVDAVLAGDLHNPSLVHGVLAAVVARNRDRFAGLRPPDAAWPVREVLTSVLPAV
jgi:8-oxo-dGTP pyrophosphatase MutT (NUDIX family)